MVDIHHDWLRAIGSNTVILCRSRLTAPWGMALAPADGVMIHIVTEGSCWVRRSDDRPIPITVGDVLLVPRGLHHDLVDHPESPAEPLESLLGRESLPDTGGPRTTLVCAVYGSDAQTTHPMLRALPPVVHIPAASVERYPSLRAALNLLTQEIESTSPGSESLVHHLIDAAFIYLIRAWVSGFAPDNHGWLRALEDPALSIALERIHAQPHAPWTVESLAREAGLSRASFARRFTDRIGETPLAYLTRWRMGVAARLLNTTDASVAEIAGRVGYESEFAFSRAFKRQRGLPPARFRQTAPDRPGAPPL